MKTTNRFVAATLLALICASLTGCAPFPFYSKNAIHSQRLDTPPPGKALVNFHMPSEWGGKVTVPIFKDDGELIGALIGGSEFQYACDPGSQVFIGFADTPQQFKGLVNEPGDVVGSIAVLQADVSPDKIYDVVIDISMGWSMPAIYLSPVTKGSDRRQELPKFEKRERKVSSGLLKSESYEQYSEKESIRIAGIKRDFVSGVKNDRLRHLNADDCR